MEKILLLATGNAHKCAEIQEIFAAEGITGWQIKTLADYPDYLAPEETGETFSENAGLKAISGALMSCYITLADDSGLTVDALAGAPGVHSARYAGEGHDDAANRKKLLAALCDTPVSARQAAFVCQVAMAFPEADGTLAMWTTEGRCEGQISLVEQGENGFGYDSLFFLPQYNRTMAELSPAEKNAISHRGAAMRQAAKLLKRLGEKE